MFTGIIEQTGRIHKLTKSGNNLEIWIESSFSHELKVDQSVSHNGVCLTIEEINGLLYRVTAIEETLSKTNFLKNKADDLINLERCMQLNGRLDGHIVQGHVDTTGICKAITEKNGSWEFTIEIDPSFASLIIEKGSVTLNGISLTIFHVTENSFTVAVIPYTFLHTNMQNLKLNDSVNIEFDMIGKYVNRIFSLKHMG